MAISASHQGELKWIKGIQTEVDSSDACSDQIVELAVQGDAIRGQAQFLQTQSPELPQLSDKAHKVLADGWLSSREPDLVDALFHEQSCEIDYLGRRQGLRVWGKAYTLFGHAVNAPQIASFSHRDPQVIVLPGVIVRQEGRKGSMV